MDKIMKWLILFCCLAAIGGGIFALCGAHETFNGKVVFETEDAYTQFKHDLAAPEVDIETISVLSSEPPIIVEFEITTPHDYSFDYGDRGKEALGVGIFLICAGIAGLAFWGVGLKREWWEW